MQRHSLAPPSRRQLLVGQPQTAVQTAAEKLSSSLSPLTPAWQMQRLQRQMPLQRQPAAQGQAARQQAQHQQPVPKQQQTREGQAVALLRRIRRLRSRQRRAMEPRRALLGSWGPPQGAGRSAIGDSSRALSWQQLSMMRWRRRGMQRARVWTLDDSRLSW